MKKILLIIILILISCNSNSITKISNEYKFEISYNSLNKLNHNLKIGLSQSKKILINDSLVAKIYPLRDGLFKLIFEQRLNNHKEYIFVPINTINRNFKPTRNSKNTQLFQINNLKFLGSKKLYRFISFPLVDQEGIELSERRYFDLLSEVDKKRTNINDSSKFYNLIENDQFDIIYLLDPFTLKYNPLISLRSQFRSINNPIKNFPESTEIDNYFDADLDETVYKIKNKKVTIMGDLINFKSKSMYVFENCDIKIDNTSFDGNNSSILFIDSKIEIHKSTFKNFSNPDFQKHGYILPSAITFYESEINVSNSTFMRNSYGDDLVNTYKTKFIFTNTKFLNSNADALDSDFSEGILENCEFVNSGNDAIDTSGSTVEIINVKVINSSDKGISSGENSNLNITNSLFKNNAIALVVKDGSKLSVFESKVQSNDLDLAVFIKKDFYSNQLNFYSDFVIEKISYLIDNQVDINTNIKSNLIKTDNVINLMYGNKYGKESIR